MSNKHNTYIITNEDSGQRIDAFLSNIYSDLSRSYIQKQIKESNVLINDIVPKPSQILKTDDIVTEKFKQETNAELKAENIAIQVLYEDTCMLVVNKPSNMLTHPTSKERSHTLVNALLHYTKGELSTCNGTDRPGIVHRLDRNTSGILMIAKNDECYEFLKEQMQNRTIEKKYYALVSGVIKDNNGTIESNIGRHPSRPEKMAVIDSGKPSITHYSVLERFANFTLLDITLETGRTHQIRVHMAHIGHPIVNDSLYGNIKLPVKTNEQTLQSYSLKFITPYDNTEKSVSIPMDNDIIKALNYLRSKK